MICSATIKTKVYDKLVQRFGMATALKAYLQASTTNPEPTYNEVAQLLINDYYKAADILKVEDNEKHIHTVLATEEQLKGLDNLLVTYHIVSKTNKFFNEIKIDKPTLEFTGKVNTTTPKISDFANFPIKLNTL